MAARPRARPPGTTGRRRTSDRDRLAVLAEHPTQHAAHLAQSRVPLRAADEMGHEVRLRCPWTARSLAQPGERCLDGHVVALAARPVETGELPLQGAGGDVENRNRDRLVLDVAVHADDDTVAGVELALEAIRRVCDLPLRIALADRPDHPAASVDLVEVAPDLTLDPVRERFDEPAAAERVDGVRDPGLLGEDLLLPERQSRGPRGRHRERLVVRVGVERLAAAEDGGERLDGDPG